MPTDAAAHADGPHLESSPDDFRSVLYSVDKDGRRRWLEVHRVGGFWGRWRLAVSLLLIAFYMVLPFLSVGGHPFLRFDLPNRRFWVAGQAFWPQDFSYLLPLVLAAIVGTLLAVALFGRVFCGWFCPHNVFLEQVFRRIEAFFQGPAHRRAARRREGRGPGLGHWLSWTAYVLVAGALANTMTALFVGTEAFRWGLLVDPVAHPTAAVFFAVFFAIILFNFAWFREQTCTIVCPYGRLQAALLDPHALVVAYDARRGEPRLPVRARKSGTAAPAGDCIDCHQCVAVCPTGIDIRNGNQLECLHCTACIDACDAVMRATARPAGLIRFASEVGLGGGRRRVVRPRTIIYALILAALIGFGTWRIAARETLVATPLRPGSLAQRIEEADGAWVRQVLPFSLYNRGGDALAVRVEFPPELQARVFMPSQDLVLPASGRLELRPIVDVPAAILAGGDRRIEVVLIAPDGRHSLPLLLRRP